MKKPKGYISFDKMLKEDLRDPEFRAEFEALEPEFKLIRESIDRRLAKEMSQKELAKKIGTKQSAISRLESGKSNPSVKFLKKVAKAFDAKLKITFQ